MKSVRAPKTFIGGIWEDKNGPFGIAVFNPTVDPQRPLTPVMELCMGPDDLIHMANDMIDLANRRINDPDRKYIITQET